MKRKEIERIRTRFKALPKSAFGVAGYPPEFIEAIHADYLRCGEILARVAPRWNRAPGSFGALLDKYGLRTRSAELTEQIKQRQRDAGGRVMAQQHAKPSEIEAIIARATKVAVPAELKWEFKTWPMEKRADFLRRLRARVNPPNERPESPFSRNLTPFDYATPAARAIMDKLNAGLNSREAVCKIDLCSQGVIYKGELWFWRSNAGYQKRGAWTPEDGRPILSRVIWAEANGRPVPPKHVVRCADGNPNNLDPSNLVLDSMNNLCRENQAAALTNKSRELTTLLLQRSQSGRSNHGHTISALKAA